ncbi:HWE histidine kinase domain-containing protein [Fulvimarina sp. MAC8]|uniref:HWE histidine kinase domain-containing protein n=1 Tax=Fulvimarina sp. MAC8 TaxID=3162874 RepID=UPI0032EACA18
MLYVADCEFKDLGEDFLEDPAFLRSVLSFSTDCIKVLDLDGNLLFMSEGGKRVMEVGDFQSIRGCPWPTFWAGEWREKADRAVATAKAGGCGHFQGSAPTLAGTTKWWDVRVTPIVEESGQITRLLSISRDITQEKLLETRLADSEKRLSAALSAAGVVGIWDYDIAADRIHADENLLRLYGLNKPVSPEGFNPREIETRIHEDDLALYRENFSAAIVGNSDFDCEFRIAGVGNTYRWMLARGRTNRNESGLVDRFSGAVVDITDRKLAQERGQIVNRELAHRIRNLLSVVGAIVSQTLRHTQTTSEGQKAISKRLQALDRAQDVLLQEEITGSAIHNVVSAAVEPHLRRTTLLSVEGLPLVLKSNQLLGLSLAMHELATNAVKYGALSRDGGKLSLHWSTRANESGERTFIFEWIESGGPIVSQPERKGFGRHLLERGVAGYFSGTAKLDFRPEGLVYRLEGVL